MGNGRTIHEILAQREEFLVIGLTGRMGSGCSKVAQLLATPFDKMNFPHPVPQPGLQSLTQEERAIRIVAEYANEHWLKFDIVHVGAIIATFILDDDRRFIYDLNNGGADIENDKKREAVRRSCMEGFYQQLVQLGQSYKLLDKKEGFYIRTFADEMEKVAAAENGGLDSYEEIFDNYFVYKPWDKAYEEKLMSKIKNLGSRVIQMVPSDEEVKQYFETAGEQAFIPLLLKQNGEKIDWDQIGKEMNYLYRKVLQDKDNISRRKYLECVDKLLEIFSFHCLMDMLENLLPHKKETANAFWTRLAEINQQVEPNAKDTSAVLQIQKFVYVKYLTAWFGKSIRSYVTACLGDDAYARLFQRYGQMIRYHSNILPYEGIALEPGKPGTTEKQDKKEDIFAIPRKINQYIKVLRHPFDSKEHRPVRVVIDSIKNIFEAVYLRYRYSAFYLWAITTDPAIREQRLRNKHFTDIQVQMMDWNEYPDIGGKVIAEVEEALQTNGLTVPTGEQWDKTRKSLIEKIQPAKVDFYLDNLSTKFLSQPEKANAQKRYDYCKEYEKFNTTRREFFKNSTRAFYTQDIDSCISNADVYLFNNAKGVTDTENNRKLLEAVVRYVSLVMYPCLVRPTAVERCMQIAFSAKVNSGCLSRQVGAVVTDSQYNILAIGWNDVPCGEISCAYKNMNDIVACADQDAYSEYELHDADFRERITKYKIQPSVLRGLPFNYCFKNVHKDVKDPMRSRAMHGEEKALALCGQEAQGGYLFTTSSPCEMCSKNAKNHKIAKIFYLEAYPGISQAQYTNSGDKANRAELILFSGAVGRAYMQMYTPLLPHKDVLEHLGVRKTED